MASLLVWFNSVDNFGGYLLLDCCAVCIPVGGGYLWGLRGLMLVAVVIVVAWFCVVVCGFWVWLVVFGLICVFGWFCGLGLLWCVRVACIVSLFIGYLVLG